MIEQVGWGVLRGAVIATLALLLAPPLAQAFDATRGRGILRVLILAPLLTPALLVSYAYSRLALAWLTHPECNHALYSTVLLLKLAPLAALAWRFFPPALTPEAVHCHILLRPTLRQRVLFRLRGAGAPPWLAFGIVFLLAFGEFELASLWNVNTWPVLLFDAHVGGLALVESVKLAALPMIIEAVLLFAIIRLARRAPTPPTHIRNNGSASITAISYAAASALIVTLVPVWIVAGQSFDGWLTLLENFVLAREIAVSVAFGVAAAFAASAVIFLRRLPGAWIAPAAVGLLGPLVVSLLMLYLFQAPLLRFLYDTPAPLVIALVLLLVPPAILLRWMHRGARRSEALHVAGLCECHRVWWLLEGRHRYFAVFVLFCWAYFDFTASSILAPVGATPVFVRLHNLAHYGQSAVLSAMLLAAALAPVAVLALTIPIARLYPGSNVR